MNKIKILKEKLGVNNKDFAELLDVSQSAVFHYMNDSRRPKFSICHRIINLAKKIGFKITLEDLRPQE